MASATAKKSSQKKAPSKKTESKKSEAKTGGKVPAVIDFKPAKGSGIGISANARARLAAALGGALADTYLLLLKTQNYHWNVTGSHFGSLHTLFETQYQDLFLAADAAAERIRALGHPAPGSYAEFVKIAQVKEDAGLPRSWDLMVRNLMADHESISRTTKEVIELADEAGDDATADLMTQRQAVHDKAAWMLRSYLA